MRVKWSVLLGSAFGPTFWGSRRVIVARVSRETNMLSDSDNVNTKAGIAPKMSEFLDQADAIKWRLGAALAVAKGRRKIKGVGDLAAAVGVSASHAYRWLNGAEPSAKQAVKISDFLRINPGWLLLGARAGVPISEDEDLAKAIEARLKSDQLTRANIDEIPDDLEDLEERGSQEEDEPP